MILAETIASLSKDGFLDADLFASNDRKKLLMASPKYLKWAYSRIRDAVKNSDDERILKAVRKNPHFTNGNERSLIFIIDNQLSILEDIQSDKSVEELWKVLNERYMSNKSFKDLYHVQKLHWNALIDLAKKQKETSSLKSESRVLTKLKLVLFSSQNQFATEEWHGLFSELFDLHYSIASFSISLRLIDEYLDRRNVFRKGWCYLKKAQIYNEQKNIPLSLKFYKIANKYASKEDDILSTLIIKKGIYMIYVHWWEKEKAKQVFSEIESMMDEPKAINVRLILLSLSIPANIHWAEFEDAELEISELGSIISQYKVPQTFIQNYIVWFSFISLMKGNINELSELVRLYETNYKEKDESLREAKFLYDNMNNDGFGSDIELSNEHNFLGFFENKYPIIRSMTAFVDEDNLIEDLMISEKGRARLMKQHLNNRGNIIEEIDRIDSLEVEKDEIIILTEPITPYSVSGFLIQSNSIEQRITNLFNIPMELVYEVNQFREMQEIILENNWKVWNRLSRVVLDSQWHKHFESKPRVKYHLSKYDHLSFFPSIIAAMNFFSSAPKEIKEAANRITNRFSRKFYDMFIQCNIDSFAGKTTIIVIPDDKIGLIPIEALKDSNDEYLVNQFDVIYCTSLLVWRSLNKRRKLNSNKGFLLFGVTEYPSSDWVNLNFPKVIARTIGKNELNSSIFMNNEVSKKKVESFLTENNYAIVHFAMHGIFFPEIPDSSALILSFSSGVGKECFLYASDIRAMHINCDLIILSACNTMIGYDYTGEGMLGLSHAFLCAGAKSVISSRWAIEDKATGIFFEKFYEFVFDKEVDYSYSMALTMTKRFFIEDDEMKKKGYDHPYYWAGFKYEGA